MKKTSILGLSLLMTLILSLETSVQGDLPNGAIARLGKGAVNGITYSSDGDQLVVASSVGIWSYDVATGEELPVFVGYTGFVLSIAYSPNGAVLASGAVDDTVRLWDANTGDPINLWC